MSRCYRCASAATLTCKTCQLASYCSEECRKTHGSHISLCCVRDSKEKAFRDLMRPVLLRLLAGYSGKRTFEMRELSGPEKVSLLGLYDREAIYYRIDPCGVATSFSVSVLYGATPDERGRQTKDFYHYKDVKKDPVFTNRIGLSMAGNWFLLWQPEKEECLVFISSLAEDRLLSALIGEETPSDQKLYSIASKLPPDKRPIEALL